MPGRNRPLDSDWLPVRDFLHGPERERSLERPEIRLQSEPVVAHVIDLVLREESRYGLLGSLNARVSLLHIHTSGFRSSYAIAYTTMEPTMLQ